jgi:hypothetical protein
MSGVYRVMRQVQEKRFLTVCLDELLGFSGQSVGEIFAGWRLFESGNESLAALVGSEVIERRACLIPAMLISNPWSCGDEPCRRGATADMRGDVAGGLQRFRERDFAERKIGDD